jgi:hypothetical protein
MGLWAVYLLAALFGIAGSYSYGGYSYEQQWAPFAEEENVSIRSNQVTIDSDEQSPLRLGFV